mmetsp:Transcript_17592/g.50012  ORF Transcript_17592/g.50012 Transcript_17592/m.50012 type:complete len:331 (+) Transcript_17592:1192-2184(+)
MVRGIARQHARSHAVAVRAAAKCRPGLLAEPVLRCGQEGQPMHRRRLRRRCRCHGGGMQRADRRLRLWRGLRESALGRGPGGGRGAPGEAWGGLHPSELDDHLLAFLLEPPEALLRPLRERRCLQGLLRGEGADPVGVLGDMRQVPQHSGERGGVGEAFSGWRGPHVAGSGRRADRRSGHRGRGGGAAPNQGGGVTLGPSAQVLDVLRVKLQPPLEAVPGWRRPEGVEAHVVRRHRRHRGVMMVLNVTVGRVLRQLLAARRRAAAAGNRPQPIAPLRGVHCRAFPTAASAAADNGVRGAGCLVRPLRARLLEEIVVLEALHAGLVAAAGA